MKKRTFGGQSATGLYLGLCGFILFVGACTSSQPRIGVSTMKNLVYKFPGKLARANVVLVSEALDKKIPMKDWNLERYKKELRVLAPENADTLLRDFRYFDQPPLFHALPRTFIICMRIARRDYSLCDEARSTGMDIKCRDGKCRGPAGAARGRNLEKLAEALRKSKTAGR